MHAHDGMLDRPQLLDRAPFPLLARALRDLFGVVRIEMHADEVVAELLHRFGERVVRGAGVGEHRVATRLRQRHRVEQGAGRRARHERHVGVPEVGAILDAVDRQNARVLRQRRFDRMPLGDLTELRRERGLRLGREVLVGEEHDEVLEPGRSHRGQRVGVERYRTIEAADLGADGRRQAPDVELHGCRHRAPHESRAPHSVRRAGPAVLVRSRSSGR